MNGNLRLAGPDRSFRRFTSGFVLAVLALLTLHVRANPAHAQEAKREKPPISSPTRELSPEDLEHGRRQMEQMLRDRPAMAFVVNEQGKKIVVDQDSFLWKWCVRKFAGEDVWSRIHWRSDRPPFSSADHAYSEAFGGFIRISDRQVFGPNKGKPRSFEAMWADAIFELHNIQNAYDSYDHFVETLAGLVTRQGYVRRITELEHRALMKQVVFYEKSWKPWSSKNRIPTNPVTWRVSCPRSYEAWIAGYTDPGGYPWNPYGKYYEETLVPYLKRKNRTARVDEPPHEAIVVYMKRKAGKRCCTVGRRIFSEASNELSRFLAERTDAIRAGSRKAIVVIVYDNRFSEQALSRVEQACEQARVDRVVIIREFPDLKHGAGK